MVGGGWWVGGGARTGFLRNDAVVGPPLLDDDFNAETILRCWQITPLDFQVSTWRLRCRACMHACIRTRIRTSDVYVRHEHTPLAKEGDAGHAREEERGGHRPRRAACGQQGARTQHLPAPGGTPEEFIFGHLAPHAPALQ